MPSRASARRTSSAKRRPPAKRRVAPDPGLLSPDELLQLRGLCDRSIAGHGLRTTHDVLAEITSLPDEELREDWYGEGGAVATLETEVRELLGKPAAVFMPSGTMAQQIALRIHADRRGRTVVAFHPTSHLELWEDKAYQRLHGLVGRHVGDSRELISVRDLEEIEEPLAAVLFELPQREIGGRLPAWDDLVAQVELVRGRGAAVHLDGARIWECQPFYDRPLAEIAGLFDSIYVSFYKGLGAPVGSMLLGEDDVIAEARVWRHVHGGTLFKLWPYAAAGLAGLRSRLPRMAAYAEHARAIGAELAKIAGVDVVPDPPQTSMLHIHLRTTTAVFAAGVRRLATEERIWAFSVAAPTETPGIRRLELSVGEATLGFSPAEIARLVRSLLPA
jgi:threonine aldolase